MINIHIPLRNNQREKSSIFHQSSSLTISNISILIISLDKQIFPQIVSNLFQYTMRKQSTERKHYCHIDIELTSEVKY